MAPSSKPPTTLKISIQTVGTRESVQDLFERLADLGVLSRSLDIALNVGVYFEDQGREMRRQVHELIREHPAVFRAKSYVHLSTKTGADESLFETQEDYDGAQDGDGESDDDELPMERALRESGAIGEFAQRYGVESVTLTHRSPGQPDRVVELTAETRERAAEALRRAGGE